MILLGNIMIGVARVLDSILYVVMLLVIAHAVLSWVSPDPFNAIVRFINSTVEPLLRPIRKFVPLIGPGIDLSPIVLLALIVLLQAAVVQSLLDYGSRFRQAALYSQARVIEPGINYV